ncbi:recombinase RecR [Bifidobacterium margollesii]|uniref:Recombination protein RecR n=1 Tax=Bifidobacterium margollesii TaxID=2020964 RepID=A0A2N5JC42_9BIFI|nr:recombination mediator RecR [Bifidobacterium margollesii]PLS31780.1 recombinase RecR [Bifidobacterium margollesii]
MALAYDGAIQHLIDSFARLPGIGPKGAQRIAFYLLGVDDAEAQELADAITEVKARVRFCDICGNVCETSPCPICADPRRDHTVICVVQEPKDVMSIERTREFRGVYHVLGGAINPMANVGPQDLNIPKLLRRLSPQTAGDPDDDSRSGESVAAQGTEDVQEVILALNPNIEGEATTTYLSRLISPCGVKVTRLASGLPVGGDLEYADEITLGRALVGRREA